MKQSLPYIILLCFKLLMFGILSSALAQQENFTFDHLGLEDGLSQSSVTTIIQDQKGFMWFGTTGGLNRYDGREMVVYRSGLVENKGLSDKHVTDMCKDKDGNFWITTINGLTHFNLKTEGFRSYYASETPGSISHNTAYDILCEAGTIWVGTSDGLNKLENKEEGSFKFFNVPAGKNEIRKIYRDNEGVLWVGTFGTGLYYLDEQQQELVSSQIEVLSDKVITDIHEDGQGRLWVGTETGLLCVNRDRETVDVFQHDNDDPTSPSSNTVNVIYFDSRSNLWVGTENGLNLFNPEKESFRRFMADPNNPSSINSNRIHSIYEDNHNTLWIGNWTNGVDKFSYNEKGINHYTHRPEKKNTLSDDNIWDFVEDEDGVVWIGTDKGLNSFNPRTKHFKSFRYNHNNSASISGKRVFNIAKGQSGMLWLATNRGLNRFDTGTGDVKRFLADPNDANTISYNSLWGVAVDLSGRVWVSTSGKGVDRYNPQTGKFKHFKHNPDDPNSLASSFGTEIYVDSKGQVWVGTREGLNLYRMETDDFITITPDSAASKRLIKSTIIDIHEDSSGRLWVGTTLGVAVLDIETRKVMAYYTRDNGLPDDIIWCITEDREGNVYLGTTLGIAVWNPETSRFNHFTKRDGLQGNEFNAGAAFTASTGQVYMGGNNGFNVFSPSDLGGNPYPPPVVLTDLQIYNESVPIGDKAEEDHRFSNILDQSITYEDTVTLSYSDKVVSFEFAALNYSIPEENEYAYKLDGFGDRWNYIGNRNFATYTELAPGTYTFRVKAANNDGVWNEQGTNLTLVITPPYWQTTWFYVLSGLFVVGIIFTGYWIKVRRFKQYSRRLEKEVADRTSELNSRNKELKKALEQLEEAKDELVEKAHKAGMADLATGILHNVGNILNSVNTSATMIEETMKNSKLQGLLQANSLLRKNIDQVEDFVANHPKGKTLMEYYLKLEDPLKSEQQKVIKQSKRLVEKIELINAAIAAQQSYAGASRYADHISLEEMIEDALTLQAGSIDRHGLTVEKDLESVDPIIAQHSKLMHILVNLIKNAKEAMAGNPPDEKIIAIKSWQDEEQVYLSLKDNGSGIKEEHLKKVFTHGFTTKKSGHGFGLHSCANYMNEMGGAIEVESDGPGQGATFTLIFEKAEMEVEVES